MPMKLRDLPKDNALKEIAIAKKELMQKAGCHFILPKNYYFA
jgi:hypothetical protein